MGWWFSKHFTFLTKPINLLGRSIDGRERFWYGTSGGGDLSSFTMSWLFLSSTSLWSETSPLLLIEMNEGGMSQVMRFILCLLPIPICWSERLLRVVMYSLLLSLSFWPFGVVGSLLRLSSSLGNFFKSVSWLEITYLRGVHLTSGTISWILCSIHIEKISHLFVTCEVASSIWYMMFRWLGGVLFYLEIPLPYFRHSFLQLEVLGLKGV